MTRLLLIAILVPLLSACASRYCERSEQVYETVVEKAPLESPEGLRVPAPDPSYEIPPATGEDVKYATSAPGAKRGSNCLDEPPPLATAAPEPQAEPDPEPAKEPEIETVPLEPASEPETAPAPEAAAP